MSTDRIDPESQVIAAAFRERRRAYGMFVPASDVMLMLAQGWQLGDAVEDTARSHLIFMVPSSVERVT